MILELNNVNSRCELDQVLKEKGLRPVTTKDSFKLLLNSTRVFWSDGHGMITSLFTKDEEDVCAN